MMTLHPALKPNNCPLFLSKVASAVVAGKWVFLVTILVSAKTLRVRSKFPAGKFPRGVSVSYTHLTLPTKA